MNAAVELIPAAETGTKIAEYSRTAAALADLSARFADARFDVATTAGMKAATVARAEIRGYRTSLENLRKELKAPALERSRLIDAEAKRITVELEALELPIDAQIKAEESRKEAEKAAKVEALRLAAEALRIRLDAIRTAPVVCIGMAAGDIAGELRKLESLDLSDIPEDQVRTFDAARQVAIDQLRALYADRLGAEQESKRLADERAELDRQRAEQEAERVRLAKIAEDEQAELRSLTQIVMDCAGQHSQYIDDALHDLRDDPPVKPSEAVASAYRSAINQLTAMLKSAKDAEAAAAQAAQEAEERARQEAAARAQRDAVEAAERAERARVDDLRRRIDIIRHVAQMAVGKSSATITEMRETVEKLPCDYAELTPEALDAQRETLAELDRMHAEAFERERIDAEFRQRVDEDAKRKAQAAADERAEAERKAKEAADLETAETQRTVTTCTLSEAAGVALSYLQSIGHGECLGAQMLASALERTA